MYELMVNRKNPTLIMFLLDQSGSMEDSFGGDPSAKMKKDGVVDAANLVLNEIIPLCSKPEVRDYVDISVLGYGNQKVSSAFGGNLAGKEIVKTSEVEQNPLRVDEIDGKRLPVWLEPIASGDTPMCQALNKAYGLIEEWVKEHPASYPPTIINITDGEATDGEPEPIAEKIKSLSTQDGNVLLYNCHISSRPAAALLYSSSEGELPDDKFAHLLFRMSSKLPGAILEGAKSKLGLDLKPDSRGFVFNADLVQLVKLLKFGSVAPIAR